jgi:uncharacterized protein YecE (DUF72 family)
MEGIVNGCDLTVRTKTCGVASNYQMPSWESSAAKPLIGVGGWAYLPVEKGDKLAICSKLYDFVELNSSFYKIPNLESAKRWKRAVRPGFEFTVRANRTLTHEYHLKSTDESFKIYDDLISICDALGAHVLHFQFPPSFEVTDEVINDWRQFLDSLSARKAASNALRFAFEVRNKATNSSEHLREFFHDYDIIPSMDASRLNELQASEKSKIVYTRVFGQGNHTEWSFDSDELGEIEKKVESTPAKKRYVTFHNMTMYEDASRMRNKVREGVETHSAFRGQESLRSLVSPPRVEYPLSKEELTEKLGWRTLETDSGHFIHLSQILDPLPPAATFKSPDQLLEALKSLNSTL